MRATHTFSEVPVSWEVDGIEVHASLTRPAGKDAHPAGVDTHPAVIFVAGSGPTDRDWNTPIIPGSNGSGALLARELAEHGFVTLRYDKRASGPHLAENFPRMAGKISMQGHVDELSGGVRLLARQPEVDPGRIFALTNSEGCVHALNYQAEGKQPLFAGMVLTSAFARATGELARSQIAAQLGAVPGGEAMLAAYDAAMADFSAGRPVTVDPVLPEALQQVIQGITQPVNLPFSRELWFFNPVVKLAEVSAPVLVVLGKKDIQVDWQVDGSLFEAMAREHGNVTIRYLENASHVMKFETRPRAELTPADAMATYSAGEVGLDPEAVETIVSWLKAQS